MSGQPAERTFLSQPVRERLWRIGFGGLALVAVLGTGLLLGRAMLSPEWTLAVTLVGLGGLVLALLLHPVAGLLLCIALAPFSQYIYLTFQPGHGIPALDVTRLTALLLAARLIVQVVMPSGQNVRHRRRLPSLTWLDLAMVLFSGAMLLSVLSSSLGLVDGMQTVVSFVALPLLFYYFARTWVRTRRALLAVIAALALVGAFLGFITVREQLTGQTLFSQVAYSLIYEGSIRKVLSVFRSPANMSSTLAVMVPVLFFGIQQVSTLNKRLLLAVALGLVLGGVFYTYVRGGWLGAVLGIAVLVVFNPGIRRAVITALPLVLLVVVLLSGLVLINPQVVESRLTSDQPITYRIEALQIALTMVRQSPLLGVGFENFGTLALRQFGWDPHGLETTLPSTHNSYLYVLVAGGLLAFLPYVAIFVGLAHRGYDFWRRRVASVYESRNRALVAAAWATLVGYMAIILSFDVLNAQYTNMIFFIVMGALLGVLEQANGEVVG